MRINIFTLAKTGSKAGNRITANRWSRIFRELGHSVTITNRIDIKCDLLVAIHAEKSAKAVIEFQRQFPDVRIIVAVSGTDIYGQAKLSRRAIRSLTICKAIVTLEGEAQKKLPPQVQSKAVTIRQSATSLPTPQRPLNSCLEVCVCGHLRKEKNPFLIVEAVKRLPTESTIRVTHIGAALSPIFQNQAEKHSESEPRYRWLGEKKHWRARQLINRSQLLVNSSWMESSANSVIESLVLGTPVLATNVSGNLGVFGSQYPGIYSSNDPRGLADLMSQFENDERYRIRISKFCSRLAKQYLPHVEKLAWAKLLRKFG